MANSPSDASDGSTAAGPAEKFVEIRTDESGTRRAFLKLAAAGVATAAVWRGMISDWPGESVRGPL